MWVLISIRCYLFGVSFDILDFGIIVTVYSVLLVWIGVRVRGVFGFTAIGLVLVWSGRGGFRGTLRG